MENQHRKITGYRELSQDEIDMMNDAKQLAEQVGQLISKFESHPDTDKRWIAAGKTNLQTGFMQVIRGVAKPSTF